MGVSCVTEYPAFCRAVVSGAVVSPFCSRTRTGVPVAAFAGTTGPAATAAVATTAATPAVTATAGSAASTPDTGAITRATTFLARLATRRSFSLYFEPIGPLSSALLDLRGPCALPG